MASTNPNQQSSKQPGARTAGSPPQAKIPNPVDTIADRTAGSPPQAKIPNPVDTISDYRAHDADTFYCELNEDLDNARENAVVQSPYIASRRLTRLLPVLERLTARGVRLCIYLREPDLWPQRHNPDLSQDDAQSLKESEELFSKLRNAGAHVNMHKRIHEKLVVIDNLILWSGSLNALSHRDTSERMTRMVSRHYAMEAIVKHKLDSCDICCASELCKEFNEEHAQVHLNAIVQRLSTVRKRSLSQRALAQLIRSDQSLISKFEAGTCSINSQTLVQIAGILEQELVLVPKFLVPAVEQLVFTKLRPKR